MPPHHRSDVSYVRGADTRSVKPVFTRQQQLQCWLIVSASKACYYWYSERQPQQKHQQGVEKAISTKKMLHIYEEASDQT